MLTAAHTPVRPLCLILALSVLLIGCNTASAPDQRERLHGPPLTEDEIVDLATIPGHPEQVAIEARLRGVGYELDDPARMRLASRGVRPQQIGRLVEISLQPDPLGGQANPRNTPLIAAGVVLGAAAVTGIVWLCIEIFDDADHKTVIVHNGNTFIAVED